MRNHIKIKALSANMKKVLMELYEREKKGLPPFEAGSVKYVSGLIKRALVETKFYMTANGKKIMALFLTDLGYNYLNNL